MKTYESSTNKFQKNDNFKLLRTITRNAKGELSILSNQRIDMNVLNTPSTAIFPNSTRYSTISSVQTPIATKKKWGGKPNLVFYPTKEQTLSRTGITLVLNWAASLHTCRTGDLIDKLDAENINITENLNLRFIKYGKNLDNFWDKDVVRNEVNKGMYGKYTEFLLHPNLAGKQLYQKGYDILETLKHAMPQSNQQLMQYVAENTKRNSTTDIVPLIKQYIKFLKSTRKENLAPNIIKAYNLFKESKLSDNLFLSFLDDELYKKFRQEILEYYEKYIQEGLRHNEFIGRQFPWEIEGIEIGHIQNLQNLNEIKFKIANARRLIKDFEKQRKEIVEQINLHGFEHYLIKEFIQTKNSVLTTNNQNELTFEEKQTILEKIKHSLCQPLISYAYQQGKFRKCDLPQNLEDLIPKEIKTLNEVQYVKISNELRILCNKSKIQYNNKQNLIKETPELIDKARTAVKAFLNSNILFVLTGSKEDSGALVLDILKKKNPELSEKQIIEYNLNNFGIDTCLSVISSACYVNTKAKSIYEHNFPSKITLQSQSIVTAMLNYNIDIFNSYCDNHPDLDDKRPLCDFSVSGYTLPLHNMQYETKMNLKEGWNLRNTQPFKDNLHHFFKDIKHNYNIDLFVYLSESSIEKVWNDIINIQNKIFGEQNKYYLTRKLFKCLGGAWSRSTEIEDELKSFRTQFDEKDWRQNPFGKQYRQHETGRGALTTLSPSQEAIDIAKKEIQLRKLNPFENLEDLYFILSKIKNPIDKFGLHVIFLNVPICTAVSGTAVRIVNLWDKVLKIQKNSSLPSINDMKNLSHLYLTGIKSHHTPIEVDFCLDNRRFFENNTTLI